MSVSLDKRTEDAQASIVSLLKTQAAKGIDLGDLTAQVEIAVDFSGSMQGRYSSGEVQSAVERALALSLSGLDDDGVVPVHFYDSQDYPVELLSQSNYSGFVRDWADKHSMGGTNFSPTIQNILGTQAKAKRFGRTSAGPDLESEKDEPPKLVLFVTDGEPSDKGPTEQLLITASSRPIFWQFIGLGRNLTFLQHLNNDDLPGRAIDNVGVTVFEDTGSMTDTEFFDDIIGEFFTKWLPEARRLGITRK